MNLRGQYLSATDKDKALAQLPNLIEADRKKLRKYINKVDDNISDLKIQLETAKSEKVFQPEVCVQLVKDILIEEKNMSVANQLMTDLFTEAQSTIIGDKD